jgi:hypothetical protein
VEAEERGHAAGTRSAFEVTSSGGTGTRPGSSSG